MGPDPNVTSDPQEMVQYYVNRRKGVPVKSPDLDLVIGWHPETREIGHYCGTPYLLVEAMRTYTKEKYDTFEKYMQQNEKTNNQAW